ncbi:hypothetical protein ACEPAF_7678 [Sanghuangporus sanghuang]
MPSAERSDLETGEGPQEPIREGARISQSGPESPEFFASDVATVGSSVSSSRSTSYFVPPQMASRSTTHRKFGSLSSLILAITSADRPTSNNLGEAPGTPSEAVSKTMEEMSYLRVQLAEIMRHQREAGEATKDGRSTSEVVQNEAPRNSALVDSAISEESSPPSYSDLSH